MKLLTHALAGMLFAAGLVVSGMTQPHKVLGFLDFFGSWDPSLLFVMVGAIAVHALSYQLLRVTKHPVFDTKFWLPSLSSVDRPLVLGSAIFGVGWGLAGYCPGPALSSLLTFDTNVLAFVFSMAASMGLYGWLVAPLRRTFAWSKATHSSTPELINDSQGG